MPNVETYTWDSEDVFRENYTSPTLTHSALRYTSGEMKIERYTGEGKRELAPSTRIQITSSNATSTTTTLAGAVLYAKRSCNPALARGMCAVVHVASGRSRARVYARAGACVLVHDIPCSTLPDVRYTPTCGCIYVRDVQLISTVRARAHRDACACVFRYATPDRVYPWFKNIIYSTADRARVTVHRLAIRP